MKLASSASEQNVYFTYVCLVNDIKPGGNISPNFGSNEKAPLHIIDVSSVLPNEVSLLLRIYMYETIKNEAI